MGEHTGIGWTHHTFNGVWGCQKVSPACTHCYAEDQSQSWPNNFNGQDTLVTIKTSFDLDGQRIEVEPGNITKPLIWGPGSPRRTFGDAYWNQPLRWNKNAQDAGERRRVFAYSMGDWAEDHPTVIAQLPRLHATIEKTPWLDWLLLTKRPERIRQSVPLSWLENPRANVFYGTTIESNDYLWRAKELTKVPAAVRFLSMEPLLQRVIVPIVFMEKIHWVIVGGETGKDRRRFSEQWAFDVLQQCRFLGIAFYMKQMSAFKSAEAARLIPPRLQIFEFPKAVTA